VGEGERKATGSRVHGVNDIPSPAVWLPVRRGWFVAGITDGEIVCGLTDQDHGPCPIAARDRDGNVWSFGTDLPEVPVGWGNAGEGPRRR
jgi:hypothetical protein